MPLRQGEGECHGVRLLLRFAGGSVQLYPNSETAHSEYGFLQSVHSGKDAVGGTSGQNVALPQEPLARQREPCIHHLPGGRDHTGSGFHKAESSGRSDGTRNIRPHLPKETRPRAAELSVCEELRFWTG